MLIVYFTVYMGKLEFNVTSLHHSSVVVLMCEVCSLKTWLEKQMLQKSPICHCAKIFVILFCQGNKHNVRIFVDFVLWYSVPVGVGYCSNICFCGGDCCVPFAQCIGEDHMMCS